MTFSKQCNISSDCISLKAAQVILIVEWGSHFQTTSFESKWCTFIWWSKRQRVFI